MKQILFFNALLVAAPVLLSAMDRKSDRPTLKPSAKQIASETQKSTEKNKEIIHAVFDIGALLKTADLQAPNFYEYLEVMTALEPGFTPEQSSYLRKVLLTKYDATLRSIAKPGLDSMVLNGKLIHVTFSSTEKIEGVHWLDILKKVDLPQNFMATEEDINLLLNMDNISSDPSYKSLKETRMVLLNTEEHQNNADTAHKTDTQKKWHLKSYAGKESEKILPFDGNKPIFDLAISANGQYMLAGSNQHSAYLWDRDTGTVYTLLHYGAIRAVDISADGKYAATGSMSQHVRVWHVPSKTSHLLACPHPVTQLRFSTDSKYLIVGMASAIPHGQIDQYGTQRIYAIDSCDILKDLTLTQILLMIKLIDQKDYTNELKIEACKRVYKTFTDYPILQQRLRNSLALKLIKNNMHAPSEIAQLILSYLPDVPAKKELKAKKKDTKTTAVQPTSGRHWMPGCLIA